MIKTTSQLTIAKRPMADSESPELSETVSIIVNWDDGPIGRYTYGLDEPFAMLMQGFHPEDDIRSYQAVVRLYYRGGRLFPGYTPRRCGIKADAVFEVDLIIEPPEQPWTVTPSSPLQQQRSSPDPLPKSPTKKKIKIKPNEKKRQSEPIEDGEENYRRALKQTKLAKLAKQQKTVKPTRAPSAPPPAPRPAPEPSTDSTHTNGDDRIIRLKVEFYIGQQKYNRNSHIKGTTQLQEVMYEAHSDAPLDNRRYEVEMTFGDEPVYPHSTPDSVGLENNDKIVIHFNPIDKDDTDYMFTARVTDVSSGKDMVFEVSDLGESLENIFEKFPASRGHCSKQLQLSYKNRELPADATYASFLTLLFEPMEVQFTATWKAIAPCGECKGCQSMSEGDKTTKRSSEESPAPRLTSLFKKPTNGHATSVLH